MGQPLPGVVHHPRTLAQHDALHRPARDRGSVDCFGHLKIVNASHVLDDVVAQGEIRSFVMVITAAGRQSG